MKTHRCLLATLSLLLAFLPAILHAQAGDLWFVVIVKSANHAQRADGSLELLNYHFFSEIFPRNGGKVTQATIARRGGPGAPWPYEDRGKSFYFEGGHFDSQAAVDAAFPNGEYVVNINTPSGVIADRAMLLRGDGGKTEIPAPVRIRLWQDGREVAPDRIDPGEELRITWGEYTGARADPNGIVDDMVFVVVADCHGERIVHTGLPFVEDDYLTFRETQHRVAAGTLAPGEPHSMFVELPRAIHTQKAGAVPLFTSYATATYLDLHTLGERTGPPCPDKPPPMDTGQTDRMEAKAPSAAKPPPINEQIVMLYYQDISEPVRFYQEVIGLRPTFTEEWVRIYAVTETSSVGVVRAGPGAYHTPQARNAVMLSIVTDDVEAWYRRLKAAGNVSFLKELEDNPSAPIRSFLVTDPGGYTIEFFQWRER